MPRLTIPCLPRSIPAVRAAAVLAGLLPSLAAQAPCLAAQPPRLVGLTRTSPLVLSQDTASCALSQCVPAGLPAPAATSPWAGGTAYDAQTRAVWVCNGLQIAKVDSRNACAAECPVLPMPNSTAVNPVTGLAYYDPTDTLYVTDLSNSIRWYTVGGGCQLSLAGRCPAPIPAGDTLSGCATDDATGQIFYCAVRTGNPGGRVYVAQIGSPCTPFCSFLVVNCGTNVMGPLVGLAYDPCAKVLWATDGRFTTGLSFNPTSCTVLGPVQCCTNTLEPYIGLDVLASSETSAGTNCTAGSCPTCLPMVHKLGSDPYVGNTAFTLDLVNAPGGTTAIVLLNVGPCVPPALSPPFCAGIRVLLAPPPLMGFAATGGTPGLCNGFAAVNFPIPPDPSLCGALLCSQFVGLCPGGGFCVSNALEWAIVGT